MDSDFRALVSPLMAHGQIVSAIFGLLFAPTVIFVIRPKLLALTLALRGRLESDPRNPSARQGLALITLFALPLAAGSVLAFPLFLKWLYAVLGLFSSRPDYSACSAVYTGAMLAGWVLIIWYLGLNGFRELLQQIRS
jgi:hypothetical protein